MFTLICIVAVNICNSAHIDEIDTLRSIPVIGNIFFIGYPRSYAFLHHNRAQSMVAYFRLSNSYRYFAKDILKHLMDDSHNAYTNKINY